MNLEEKLKRSESAERIDFSKYQSSGTDDPLVKMAGNSKLVIEPCWTDDSNWEGKRYRDYIDEHPAYDGIFVRTEIAKRLEIAAESLDARYQLVVRAGHRPIKVQQRLLLECAEEYKKDNPGTSDEVALEHARTFVSDPDISLPPHVCGAAVDVELLDAATGKPLDFGGKINEDSIRSYLHYQGVTEKQRENRLALLRTMLDAGFASCKPEWWHYSYGDQVWAWFFGKSESLYSPIGITEKNLADMQVFRMKNMQNFTKLDGGIIYYTQAGDQNLEMANNTVAVIRFLAGGMDEVKILADYTNSGTLDEGAIQTGFYALGVLPITQVAVIGASPELKELIMTMAQAAGKGEMIHFANSRKAAIAWLRK